MSDRRAAVQEESVKIRGKTLARMRLLQLGQRPMHQRNRNRPFAYGGSHALDVSRTNVAHGKYSGQAGLEHEGRPRKRPMIIVQNWIQIASSQDEALIVNRHAAVQPISSGRRRRP